MTIPQFQISKYKPVFKAVKFQIIVAFGLIYFLSQPVLAVTPTASPSVAAEKKDTAEEIKEKVQERIENIKEGAQKRAFWGILKNRSGLVLIIDSKGEEKRIKTTADTVFIGSNKKPVKIEDLEIGNFLIAMGSWQGNGNLDAKRILVMASAPKPSPKRIAFMAQVTKIDSTKQTLTVTRNKNNSSETIAINSNTMITKKVDQSVKKIAFGAISLNDTLVVVGTQKEEGEVITAKIIHVIPGKAIQP